MTEITRMLRSFLNNGDFSIAAANDLEDQLESYSDEPGVQDVLDVLASYRPGGGPYLYDKDYLWKVISSLIASRET